MLRDSKRKVIWHTQHIVRKHLQRQGRGPGSLRFGRRVYAFLGRIDGCLQNLGDASRQHRRYLLRVPLRGPNGDALCAPRGSESVRDDKESKREVAIVAHEW